MFLIHGVTFETKKRTLNLNDQYIQDFFNASEYRSTTTRYSIKKIYECDEEVTESDVLLSCFSFERIDWGNQLFCDL